VEAKSALQVINFLVPFLGSFLASYSARMHGEQEQDGGNVVLTELKIK
jgi:hypothetical protein